MPPHPAPAAEPPALLHLHPPLRTRSTALTVLAVIASVYTLHWASALFIPLLLGLIFSYALSPAVDRLQRWHVPRAIGAALLLLLALGGLGLTAYASMDDAAALVESLPDAAQRLRLSMRVDHGAPENAIGKVQRAATRLELAAEESGAAAPAAGRGVTRVQIEKRHFDIKDYLWSGTLGLAGCIGQASIVCFIAYFLMVTGDGFRRKVVRIAGPTFSRRKVTVQVLDEINGQIQRYLLVQALTSVLVGVATWLAFLWLGLDRAAVWGVAAAVLNGVPYLGSIVVSSGAALVGFLQFGTMAPALLVGAASLTIHTLSGNLLTPWLAGRASRINPFVIFVGVLAWGWLWGVWGLLLGAPLLMALKAVCDRVDDLRALGELLGD
ncbi:MAG: AI-2E family transporter [Burkholderiales bacterium]|nr:AI-2E family transporter [Burkholderiales bacterium]MDE1926952.1 AI-2E family transporter [Burkholderiales bacterium]MDE2158019.1 AI-2E family transporter [Burkholderiales bacterium]MDE2505431.1 AI-2E family transporter [Burkholderiales bacterium]